MVIGDNFKLFDDDNLEISDELTLPGPYNYNSVFVYHNELYVGIGGKFYKLDAKNNTFTATDISVNGTLYNILNDKIYYATTNKEQN